MALQDAMRFYRYVVESFDILFPGEPATRLETGQINNIVIEKEYEKAFFPMMRVSLSLDTTLYHKIIEHKLEVKFRIRLQKYAFRDDDQFQMREDILNDIFVIFLDENTPFLNKDQLKENEKITGETAQTKSNVPMDLFLFKERDMLQTKQLTNYVFSGETLTNILAYLFASHGFNKVLMTPMKNQKTYDEVLLPPITFLGNILYMNNQYGFYEKGMLLFFDMDCVYLIDKSKSCTAWRPLEYRKTVFHIRNSTDTNAQTAGTFIDDQQMSYYINMPYTSINMMNASILNDQFEGNHRLIINPYEGTSQTVSASTVQRGDGTYKVLVNRYNNPFNISAEQVRIDQEGEIISVGLSNHDIQSLTPNKEFRFTFDDTLINREYGGNYRIAQTMSVFSKEGDYFTVKGTAVFKK